MDFGIWFLIGAALVFFMQAGFAMVETGFTRAKNAGNIIMKNLMDFCIGTFAFSILGAGLMLGEDKLAGLVGLPNLGMWNDFAGYDWSSFVFNLVFCATASTIVSGAVAERTKFSSYCIYSLIISLVIYPIEAHWVWGGGWLSQHGFIDFAGSACIHSVGGLCALIGAIMIGARTGKYIRDDAGKVIKVNAIQGHSLTLGALGCFILWFGWYGFNGAAATNGRMLATIFSTTTVAPAIATVTVMIFTWLKYGKPDVALSLNGSLAGLVAITAGCDVVNVMGAFIIGILSGFNVCFFTWFLDYKLHIDDPVGAVPVHFANGALGTICVGLFGCNTASKVVGLFYGGGTRLLLVQILGLLAIGVWTAITMTITFVAIKKTIGLRVTPEEEIIGLDKLEHGLESAYAGFAFESELSQGEVYDEKDYAPVKLDTVPVTDYSKKDGKITKVVIVTKPERFGALKDEMNKIGVAGLTATRVSGCGLQKGSTTYYRGAKVDMKLLPKLKVEVIISKIPTETVVNAAKKALYTGEMGDGKIFIYDVEDVVRISSNTTGVDALDYDKD